MSGKCKIFFSSRLQCTKIRCLSGGFVRSSEHYLSPHEQWSTFQISTLPHAEVTLRPWTVGWRLVHGCGNQLKVLLRKLFVGTHLFYRLLVNLLHCDDITTVFRHFQWINAEHQGFWQKMWRYCENIQPPSVETFHCRGAKIINPEFKKHRNPDYRFFCRSIKFSIL